jgi:predicted DNA-binding transcriptional regulator YafY
LQNSCRLPHEPHRKAAEQPARLRILREAMRREHKLTISYVDEPGMTTDRVVWPVALAFFEGKRLLAAWCELRDGFRHFRADRIVAFSSTGIPFPTRRAVLVKTWRREQNIPDAP